MLIPSKTTIVGVAFLAYIGHSMWIMAQLFSNLQCTDTPCYVSILKTKPKMQLALFSSLTPKPISTEVTKVYSTHDFSYSEDFKMNFTLNVPAKTRRNGTLYMHVVLALEGEPLEWKTLRRDGPTIIHSLGITEYIEPRAETFNLLSDSKKDNIMYKKTKTMEFSKSKPNVAIIKPTTHIMSNVFVVLLIDNISLSHKDVPPEMAHLIHVNRNQEILPILKTDFFNTRIKDLVQVTSNMTKFEICFHYKPIGIGKLRLMLMIEHALKMIQSVGFSKKDVDEVKSMFSNTNVYILCGTVFVASIHLLFDCLSFKNDIHFWRKKNSYEGISTRSTLWRAFSQIVIFLYLMDEKTSMMVIVPTGFGVLIELWKCKKILKLNIGLNGITTQPQTLKIITANERKTEEFDKLGMKYLSYMLYPICIAGAVYSLIYQPHRSWYSWTLNSLVNGVYAFGFLFMMPQLFVNYKLKSVEALPWRAFMYRAFNTFIDDFFAFIITMPTAHRVACLRDDIVFLIYLYQRWLYPVDKNRLDMGTVIKENDETEILYPNKNDCDKKEK